MWCTPMFPTGGLDTRAEDVRGQGKPPGLSARTLGYARTVTPGLRNASGEPALRVRVIAALVLLGLVVLTAPVVVVPVLDWLTELLF
jgi:hypothetical protein